MLYRQTIVVFAIIAVAQANWLDSNVFAKQLQRKDVSDDVSSIVSQVTGAATGIIGLTGSSSPSSTSATPTTSSSSTAASTSSPSTPSSAAPSSTSTPDSSTSISSSTSDSTLTTSTPSSSSQSTSSHSASLVTSDFTSKSVIVQTQTTIIDGVTSTILSSSTSTSTGRATGTASPQSSTSNSSGMTPQTRNTVIGVVVGIGGAIILAGLGIVAYRIWGRKKDNDDDDGLMGFRQGSSGHEKTGSVSQNTTANPFQSTLENYHNPAKQVNASSNF